MKKNLISLIIAFVLCFSTSILAQFSSEWEATGGLFATSVLSVATSGNNIYLGTDGEGVFCSTNNGESWTNSNVGLTNTTVRALTVDGTNVFAGTASGIFLSTNNGESWTATNNGLTNTNIYAIANNGSNIFAGSNGGGMFLSTNNGSDWIGINNGLNATLIRAISIYDNVLYVGTGYSSNSGVYVSSNNGSSWTQMNTGLTNINVTSLSASDGNLFAGTAGGGVFYSSNDGANWSQVNTGLTDNNINAVTINGANVYASTSETGIFKSTNNGQNWIGFNNGLLNSKMNCLYSKENIIIAGNSSGAFNTTNTEDAWTQFFTGTNPNLDVAKLAIKDNYIFAGTGNGSGEFFVSSNQGLNWNHIQTFYLPINNLVVSGNSVYFSPIDFIYQSTDNGQNWSVIGNFVLWHIHSFVVSGSNIYICYGQGGGFGIFKSTNNGADWTQLNTFQAQSFALNGDYVYAGGFNGSITISSDNGSSWIQSNLGTNSNVKQLLVVGNDLYAATDAGVFKSINNGIDWTQINTGLTNTVINSLAANSNYIFAGTGEGFFVSSNNGNNWELAGLDSCNIQTITLNDSTLYAGTFGNGIFKRALTQQQITLNPPVLLSPENNSSSIPTNPVLEWSSVENASSYTLQISLTNGFEEFILNQSGIESVEFQLSSLEYNTTYFWRVNATNGEQTSDWSSVWSFTTEVQIQIATPLLIAPSNNVTTAPINISLIWGTVTNANSYNLQVSLDSNFNEIFLEQTEINETNFLVNNLNYNTNYYWRVKAFVGSQSSAWSLVRNFKTVYLNLVANPSCELPLINNNIQFWNETIGNNWTTRSNDPSPFDGLYYFFAGAGSFAELSQFVNVSLWADDIDNQDINILFSGRTISWNQNPPDDAKVILDFWNLDKTEKLDSIDLGYHSTFYWYLVSQTFTPPANTRWVNIRLISLRHNGSNNDGYFDDLFLGKENSVELPLLVSPENNTTNITLNPTLQWQAVENATSYTLQVSLTNDFEEFILNQSGIEETEFQLFDLDYNTLYFWRVNATNGEQTSDWSEVWSFTTASTTQFIDINLNQGWNTISSNILPSTPNMEDMFAEMEELVIVKNADGQIFNPSQNINEIGDWNISHGYMVYVTAPATLQITGTAVDPTETEINLVSGWNLVAYLRNSPMAISTALEGISSSVILVKNNLGQLYYPAYGFNTLGNMQQGQGYWLYMNAPAVLTYPGN